MQIDHLVYGVRDLDAAVARFADEYRLHAVERGKHPEFGTANAVLPVGAGQYLELLAAADDAPAGHPVATLLSQLVAPGDRWLGTCLRPDDLDAEARRLQLEPRPARRVGSDGQELHWRLLAMEAALGPERLPYFIDWGENAPAHEAPDDAGGFAWMELGGDEVRVRTWVGDAPSLPLRFRDGAAAGVQAAAIQRGDQVVVIP